MVVCPLNSSTLYSRYSVCNTYSTVLSACANLVLFVPRLPDLFLHALKRSGSLGTRLVLTHCIVEPLCFGRSWDSLIKGGVLISCVHVALLTSYMKGGILISGVVLCTSYKYVCSSDYNLPGLPQH